MPPCYSPHVPNLKPDPQQTELPRLLNESITNYSTMCKQLDTSYGCGITRSVPEYCTSAPEHHRKLKPWRKVKEVCGGTVLDIDEKSKCCCHTCCAAHVALAYLGKKLQESDPRVAIEVRWKRGVQKFNMEVHEGVVKKDVNAEDELKHHRSICGAPHKDLEEAMSRGLLQGKENCRERKDLPKDISMMRWPAWKCDC